MQNTDHLQSWSQQKQIVHLMSKLHGLVVRRQFVSTNGITMHFLGLVNSKGSVWAIYCLIVFTEPAPLGWFSHRVPMFVCFFVSLFVFLFAPSGAVFFKASHWPWNHMISTRPLIGPSPPFKKIYIYTYILPPRFFFLFFFFLFLLPIQKKI